MLCLVGYYLATLRFFFRQSLLPEDCRFFPMGIIFYFLDFLGGELFNTNYNKKLKRLSSISFHIIDLGLVKELNHNDHITKIRSVHLQVEYPFIKVPQV
jgi:hypothetical protein